MCANAGEVTASYCERLQNKEGESQELSQVKEKLQKKMATAYNSIMGIAETTTLILEVQRLLSRALKFIPLIH